GGSGACGGVSQTDSGVCWTEFSRATTNSGFGVSTDTDVVEADSVSYAVCRSVSSSELSSNLAVSKATSRSHVRLKSSEALRNSASPFPIERASVGSLRGPKKISAITRIKSNSVLPSESRISAKNTARFHLPEKLQTLKSHRSGNTGKSRTFVGDAKL